MPLLPDLYVAELPRIDAAIARELKALSPPLRPVAEHIAFLPGKRLRPLFCLTLALNIVALVIVRKYREQYE